MFYTVLSTYTYVSSFNPHTLHARFLGSKYTFPVVTWEIILIHLVVSRSAAACDYHVSVQAWLYWVLGTEKLRTQCSIVHQDRRCGRLSLVSQEATLCMHQWPSSPFATAPYRGNSMYSTCLYNKNTNHCEILWVDSIVRHTWGNNLITTPTQTFISEVMPGRVTRQSLDHLIFKTSLWLDSAHCVPEEGRQLHSGPSRALVLAPLLTPC